MARPLEQDGAVYQRQGTNFWWMRYRDRNGILRKESTGVKDWQAAQEEAEGAVHARDGNILEIVRRGEALNFGQWADFFLENYSKPPIRELKTHNANQRATKHLRVAFGAHKLFDVTADDIELFLRERLRQRIRTKTKNGYHERSLVKPATVHQELRVLRRMLNVAVRKKLLPSNPCSSVEFPVVIKRLFKPHYVTWSEQQRIEGEESSVLAQHRSHPYGDRLADQQGTSVHAEGSGGHRQRHRLDSGFEDGEWGGGSPAHTNRRGCVSKPTLSCRTR